MVNLDVTISERMKMNSPSLMKECKALILIDYDKLLYRDCTSKEVRDFNDFFRGL